MQEIHPSLPVDDRSSSIAYFWIIAFLLLCWGIIFAEIVIYCLVVNLFNGVPNRVLPQTSDINSTIIDNPLPANNRFSENSTDSIYDPANMQIQ